MNLLDLYNISTRIYEKTSTVGHIKFNYINLRNLRLGLYLPKEFNSLYRETNSFMNLAAFLQDVFVSKIKKT